MVVFAQRLNDRQQNHGWSNPAGRDLAGSNLIFKTADISCRRTSYISSLVPLADDFSGFVVFMKRFREFCRFAAGMWLCRCCSAYATCLDLSASKSPPGELCQPADVGCLCW